MDDALDKLQADLDWRGPSGRAMGHVVLTREQARALRDGVVGLRAENAKLREAANLAVDLKADEVARLVREQIK